MVMLYKRIEKKKRAEKFLNALWVMVWLYKRIETSTYVAYQRAKSLSSEFRSVHCAEIDIHC